MTAKRKKTSQPSGKSILALIIFLLLVYVAYNPLSQALNKESDPETSTTSADTQEPGREGNIEIPAKLSDRPEQILERMTYTVSFNSELNLPNWVAWELTPEKLVEREGRTNKFEPDPDIRPEADAVTTDDYKGSGYDRGHMCPAADNRWHWRAMIQSFYMTNICPQTHKLNGGDWKELEDKCRNWAQQEGSVYIVCGPLLDPNVEHKTIGSDHRVTVPERFYKVVLCTACKTPRAIGFVFKNDKGNHPLSYYACSVDEVESLTGIDFFPNLPDEIETVVEANYNYAKWN